jgi:hypothetical protein
MSLEEHDRAKKLLACARVEGISTDEQRWLDTHLAGCSACSNEDRTLDAAIASFRMLSVNVDPDTVRRTVLAVHRRAKQLETEREHAGPLCIAAAMSGVWAVLTTPYAWLAFGWLGREFGVSEMSWQLSFLAWWFLPNTILVAAAAWQHVERRKASQHGAVDLDWGQL